ncbi:hypothetical protein INR76_06105 [Marixanthomonas sp. SCSIO 43207]|uniref:hypothetical protein n=1 Tax=Marixanthomonas sp. SCSIO 43207 TaxID=2779360 RepID=UPI001CA8C363|nr:hypothetical protein [Marixanthomonas sp. SCSIO 43207]UAB82331.1 hypothetical protein INR76_06105 [Marixanthomonas sp. SCSIO 43207]
MNIIQELTEKYSGKYSEGLNKSVNSPIGKYVYQPKNGIIKVDGTKISINLNEVGGAMPVTEPFRITLHLDKTYKTELTIFPIDSWNKFLNFLFPKRRAFVPKPILKQFWFGGNIDLLKQLASDKYFCEKIINERIYIETGFKTADRIVLTPEYGIKDIEQFEKYVSILKSIEKKIKTAHNNV